VVKITGMAKLKDTSLEAENYQIELFRNAPIEKHIGLLRSLTEMVLQLSRRAIQEAHKDSDKVALRSAIVAHYYDRVLAKEMRERLLEDSRLDRLIKDEMSKPDILTALIPVVEALDQIGIPYHIGGSFASSAYGVPRATADVDLVADMRVEHVDSFVRMLENAYYINEKSIRNAIGRRSSFNLIHLDTMLKVDIFIPKQRPYDREVMQRVLSTRLEDSKDARAFYLKSPEDIILTKLEWYHLGGGASERQWSDLLGVLKVQSKRLNLDYLRKWAVELGIIDLLERALSEAGDF